MGGGEEVDAACVVQEDLQVEVHGVLVEEEVEVRDVEDPVAEAGGGAPVVGAGGGAPVAEDSASSFSVNSLWFSCCF